MAQVQVMGAGGSDISTDVIDVNTDDFILVVNGRDYRISTNDKGELMFALINGVDCRIENNGGMWGNAYPGITITKRGAHVLTSSDSEVGDTSESVIEEL